MSKSNEFELAKKVFYSNICHGVTKEGIRIVVVDKPWIYRDVKIPDKDIKIKVSEWLDNPSVWDRKEYDEIREHLWKTVFTMLELIFEYGDMPRGLFITMIIHEIDEWEKEKK